MPGQVFIELWQVGLHPVNVVRDRVGPCRVAKPAKWQRSAAQRKASRLTSKAAACMRTKLLESGGVLGNTKPFYFCMAMNGFYMSTFPSPVIRGNARNKPLIFLHFEAARV